MFEALIGETVTGVRYGTWDAWDREEQCETVVEFTCESGKIILVCATDDINERYFSNFREFEEHSEGSWLEPLGTLRKEVKT